MRILHESEKRLKYDMVWRIKPQEHLQLALDKLSFANSAYQDREINSCLVSDDINYRVRMNNMFSVRLVKAILALQHLDYSSSPLTMFLLTDL